MYAFYRIIECQLGLELLKISARTNTLGWKEAPLTIPSLCNDGLRVPLKIEIQTRRGCYLHLDDDSPIGKAVVLNIKGPIYIATLGASDSLHWYTLKSRPASRIDKGYMSLQWQPAEAQGSAKSPVIVISRDAAGHAADLNCVTIICGSFRRFLYKFRMRILLLLLVSLCIGRWLHLFFASSHYQRIACQESGLLKICTEVFVAGEAAVYRFLSLWWSMKVSERVKLLLKLAEFFLELLQPAI